MTAFDDLIPGRAERTLIYGGTRSGKSSIADILSRAMVEQRPDLMMLVFDTKPRFRCQFEAHGPNHRWRKSAADRYKSWDAGPIYPNSVLMPLDIDLSNPKAFRHFWKPGEIVVLQSGDSRDRPRMLEIARKFVNMNAGGRERCIWVNEGMDFYGRNTLGIDTRNDVILDAARAGGERGIGIIFEAHRPYGIPPLLNVLTSRVFLLHLRFQKDMRYLYDIGIPEEDDMPEGNYIFHMYTIEPGGTVSKPVVARMKYPDWYLKQLSST